MSRVLANILGAAEPAFRQQILQLERAAGLPSTDIRLTMHVVSETKAKIRELGLDPHDTTGPELYSALQTRLCADEVRVRAALNPTADMAPLSLLLQVAQYLNKQDTERDIFVVKQPVMRTILKKLQPKNTMKKLGYRSMDSMLKHEPIAQLLAAATLLESPDWQHRRLEAYKKLTATDFETRRANFLVPTTKQWPKLAAAHVAEHQHNILSVPELGAVLILPLEQDLPALTITTLLLAVDALNDIRALSSYLKLQQVHPGYGRLFSEAMQREPMTAAEITGQPLAWKVVQWFYGHGHSAYHPEFFQPHVQPEDLSWHDAEDLLAGLHPALEFWQGSQLLAMLDGSKPVSLNLLDVALSICNGLSYGERIVQHMQSSLGRELLARYLHQDNLHDLLIGKLDAAFAPGLAYGD